MTLFEQTGALREPRSLETRYSHDIWTILSHLNQKTARCRTQLYLFSVQRNYRILVKMHFMTHCKRQKSTKGLENHPTGYVLRSKTLTTKSQSQEAFINTGNVAVSTHLRCVSPSSSWTYDGVKERERRKGGRYIQTVPDWN